MMQEDNAMYELGLVDDEELILNGMAHSVDWGKTGYHLAGCFIDGKSVIDAIENGSHFDLLLTDIRMDDVSGIDLAKYVYERRLHIRIVFLSGYREFEYAQKGMEYGVMEYLTKPCSIERIEQTLIRIAAELDYGNPSAEQDLFSLHSLPKGSSDLMERLLGYINNNCQQPLQLEDIAKRFYLHPAYLSRMFKEKTGITFKEYLTRSRISKANELLRNRELKVAEIAQMVGYHDLHHFYDLYKRLTGYSPTEYRESQLARMRGEM